MFSGLFGAHAMYLAMLEQQAKERAAYFRRKREAARLRCWRELGYIR